MIPIKTNLANKANYGSKRSLSSIKYIVEHFTANDGDHDESNGNYFHNNVTGTSSHYFVDSDSITQVVPDDCVAFAVGGKKYNTAGGRLYGVATNDNTISIELCDDICNGVIYPSAQTIQNALELTEQLMKKYNIPKENVIRHYDVNGKPCPNYWTDDSRWKSEFWDLIGTSQSPSGLPVVNSDVIYYAQVSAPDLRIKRLPQSDSATVGYTSIGTFSIVEEQDGYGRLKSGAGWISINSDLVTKKSAEKATQTASQPTTPAATSNKKSNEEIAQEILKGTCSDSRWSTWGNGNDRKSRLTQAGYDYSAIQAIINGSNSTTNSTVKKTPEQIADEIIKGVGNWGTGSERRQKVTAAGYNYEEVRAIVNKKLKG